MGIVKLCALLCVAGVALTEAGAEPFEHFGGELGIGDSIAGLSFDINADGFFDINFAYFGLSVNSIFAWSGEVRAGEGIPDARFAAAADENGFFVHRRFDPGETVGPGAMLDAVAGSIAYEDFFTPLSGGPWLDREPGAVGFSFLIDGLRHYGYAEVDIENDEDTQEGFLVLTRIAYETTPETPIVVGEPVSCPADLAEPMGVLNFFDIAAYVALFNAMDDAADLAEPTGVWNFFDISAYIAAFNLGCP